MFMKTDEVLTIDEYLRECGGAPIHERSPARECSSRFDQGGKQRCRSWRGGSRLPMRPLGPSLSGLSRKQSANPHRASQFSFNKTNEVTRMEYIIAFAVGGMVALYTLLIRYWLKNA
jgi:hypothetical protein